MLQKKFHKGLLLLCALMFSSHTEGATEWLPVRVLGMVYPMEARAARIEGDVKAACSMRSDGSVASVAIITGHPVLARSVVANLFRWTFKQTDGESDAVREVIVTYTFHLKGDCIRSNKCKEEYWYEYPDHITVVSEMPPLNTADEEEKGK